MNGQLLTCLMSLWFISRCESQHNEICHLFGMEATCRYRVDGVCMSVINIQVKPCTNPVEVKFTIRCDKPYVDFSHTFSGRLTKVRVHGYQHVVELQVAIGYVTSDKIHIEADLLQYQKWPADLINQDLDLSTDREGCPVLNHAAKIALGVMGGLLLVVIVMIVILICVWRDRKRRRQQVNNPGLVPNEQHQAGRTPPGSCNNVSGHMTARYSVNATPDRSNTVQVGSENNGAVVVLDNTRTDVYDNV